MGPLEPVDLLRVEISKFRLRHLKEQKKCTDKEFEPLRPIFTELSHIISLSGGQTIVIAFEVSGRFLTKFFVRYFAKSV